MDSIYISRINQWDALQLDEEVSRILQNQTQNIFKLFKPGIAEIWSPEINVLVRTLTWIFTFSKSNSTFGQKLLNLFYLNVTKEKAGLLLFISTSSKYLKEKFMNANNIKNGNQDKLIRKYSERVFDMVRLLSFINLLIFLYKGNQPTILERILNLSSRNMNIHKPRIIGYSYVTRELLWHSLMELFTTDLPLINYYRVKKYLSQFWPKRKMIVTNLIKPVMTLHTTCSYCNESPNLPSHAACHHIYCYYCIMAHFSAANSFNCIACEVELHSRDMETYSIF